MSAPDLTERITVVSCRSWPIIGNGRCLDDLAVVISANRVVATSLAAEQQGVTPGLRRREAQRRASQVQVLAPDLAGEARAFEPVLRALEQLTPRVEIDRPGTCSFLTRGPSRYFKGDQAMSEQVAKVIADALQGRTTVHVGTADSRFAAMRAAAAAHANGARVIAPGQSAGFLDPLPLYLLAADTAPGPLRTSLEDLIDVVARLGLGTLGAFGALAVHDVVARFGAIGVQAHRWARGLDHRPVAPQEPPADFQVSIELDSPVQRVDQAAFVARALADEFITKLRSKGVSCARVGVVAETEHGEEQVRLWRSDEAFSATAIADRMRWQLDGWLAGPLHLRPTGGLVKLALRPDDLSVAAGRQLGFWGEQTGSAERAARAVARVQGIAGVGVVVVPEVQGGRSPGEMVTTIPAESVDLVERAGAVDRTLIGAAVSDPAAGVEGELARFRWAGKVPRPAPAIVHDPALLAQVVDGHGEHVKVNGRGLMEQRPEVVTVAGQRAVRVQGWSGPWLIDERWWQSENHRRSARIQVTVEDGRALLLATQAGTWVVEATYD